MCFEEILEGIKADLKYAYESSSSATKDLKLSKVIGKVDVLLAIVKSK